MKAIILKNNLKEALGVVEKATVNNLNLPVLSNILLKTENGKIVLSSTNLEYAITCFTQGKILEEGGLTVPAAPFSAIVNNLNNERISLEQKNTNLEIKTDNYEAIIQGLSADEFPIIPKISNNEEYIEINSDILKSSLNQVVIAAQVSELRPEISGVFFNLESDALKLASTDSFRLAEKTISKHNFKNTFPQGMRAIIPLRTAQEVIRTFKDNIVIKIHIDSNQILFETPEQKLISRIIDGNFPDYQAIIPKSYETELILNKEELVNAIKLTGVLTSQNNDITLKLNENKKVIEFSSFNQKFGKNQYLLPVKTKGAPVQATFNWRFLLDNLKTLPNEDIFIGLNGDNRPALIKLPNDISYFYIVMPIKNS